MKTQLEYLRELQDLVLIKDGFAAHAGLSGYAKVEQGIVRLEKRLEPEVFKAYDGLVKRNKVFLSVMRGETCGGCAMKLMPSVLQKVRLGKTMKVCPHCGRILCVEPEDAVRGLMPPRKKEISKATLGRFSAEELVVPNLKATSLEQAVAELADLLEKKGYVSDGKGLTLAALRREMMLLTSMEGGLAFPHVRGVEGGQLVFAIGRSKKGIEWGERVVHYVFLSAFPATATGFYLKMVGGIAQTFREEKKRGWIEAGADRASLWKGLLKATRVATK